MSYELLKRKINRYIKENNVGAITGEVLNHILNDMIDANLKGSIGAFKFVDNDADAESAFTNGGVGTPYQNTIDGLTAGTDTDESVILLMNDDDDTPTKTMMIATEDNGSGGFQFIYIGDLQDALPSDIGERLEDLEDELSSVKDRETIVSESQIDLSDYELGGYYYYQLSSFPTPVLSENSSHVPQDNCFYLYDATAVETPSDTPPVDFTDYKLYIDINPLNHDYIVIRYHAWCRNTSGRHFGFTDENGTAVKVYKEGSLMDQTLPNTTYQQKEIEIVEKLTPDMKRFYFSCFKYSTNNPNLSILYRDYRFNPNSIPVIEDVIGDKDGIREALGSDNIYQSIFNINERRDLYRLDKFKLRNLVSRKFKRFDLGKVYGDVRLGADDYISKLPLKDLFYDGNKFLIVPREEMQMTGMNLYVSPTGNGDGYTEDTPTNIADALSRCNNNTIILGPGIYYTDRLSLTNVSTTIKCIHGKAILVARMDTLNFEVDNTHSNLVVSSYTKNITTVVEKVGDEYVWLSSVGDLLTCSTTPLSYYCDENNKNIYVNCSDVSGLLVTQEITSQRAAILTIDATTSSQNKHITIENIDFVGGFHNIHVIAHIDLIMRNCKMIAPYSFLSWDAVEEKWVFNGSNCLWIQSTKKIGDDYYDGNCTSIAINCECKYATYDGFNYHRDCAFIEIDCISGYHGELNPAQNSQASTSHETCVGLRINGIYYDSKKACIADVNNAFTVNVNCVAFQTSNIAGGDKYAFSIAWDDDKPNEGDHRRPVMYLFGCKSFDCTDSAHVGESTNYDTDNPAIIYSAFCELDGSGDDDSVPLETIFPIS